MADTPPDDATDRPTATDDELTPQDVAGLFEREAREVSRGDPRPIERLLGTPTRVSILTALASTPAGELPLTVAEISDRADRVTKGSFSKHEDVLLESGVLEVADTVGGTRRFRIDMSHPVAQAWAMLVTVAHWGRTPQLIDERFLGRPDDDIDEDDAARIAGAARDGVDVSEDVLEDVADVAEMGEMVTPADVLERGEESADSAAQDDDTDAGR